jgi:MerR family transcriptional regulator/heat shock protein HspR
MSGRIIPRELAARELAVSTKVLARYESLGLVQAVHEGSLEGYEPAQIRRLWSIVSYQRDLGINLAGVEVILQLVDQLSQVHHRVHHLTEELRALADEDESSSVTD